MSSPGNADLVSNPLHDLNDDSLVTQHTLCILFYLLWY